jgi:hypothetical protein
LSQKENKEKKPLNNGKRRERSLKMLEKPLSFVYTFPTAHLRLKTKQNKTKQNKTKQNKTKQNTHTHTHTLKTEQNKAKTDPSLVFHIIS